MVTFDPATEGAKATTLRITSDDTDEPTVDVALTGNGVDQELLVTGGPLGFGSQIIDAGAKASQAVT